MESQATVVIAGMEPNRAIRLHPVMNQIANPWASEDRLLVRCIRFQLTDSLRWAVREKITRLFRLEREIERVIVEIERACSEEKPDRYTARAEVERPGGDLKDSATDEDPFKSIDLLIGKIESALSAR